MSGDNIAEGAVVRLRSGGPMMTVNHIVCDGERYGNVHCVWVDEQGQPQREAYHAFCLKLEFGEQR